MRPLIGLTASDQLQGTTTYIRSPQTYFQAVWQAGGMPVLLQPDENQAMEALAHLDGLLLTGGGDIDPARLGQEPHPKTGDISQARDACEYALVKAFVQAEKPILGICRGMQVLAAALGGELCQHVPDLPHVRLDHSDSTIRHGVTFAKDSLLYSFYGEQAQVNSTHHQSVLKAPDGFAVTAVSEDGVMEAIESGCFVGVQWHPERILAEGDGNKRLFRWLTDQAERRL